MSNAAPALAHSNDFQGAFARTVLAPDAPVPAVLDPSTAISGFDVYRNNVVVSLIDALVARYPVVRRLLWDEVFHAVARIYIGQSPPRSPVLLEYGQDFPDFIRHFGDCAGRLYVADIATLEDARVRAYHAADADAVDRATFAALDGERLAAMHVRLHPSVTLLKSDFPVVTVWESEQIGVGCYLREWKPEAALIARPEFDVEVRLLPDGGYEFLAALAAGGTIADAIAAAQPQDGFDLASNLAVLIGSGVVVELLSDQD
jgi:hypothetical protein